MRIPPREAPSGGALRRLCRRAEGEGTVESRDRDRSLDTRHEIDRRTFVHGTMAGAALVFSDGVTSLFAATGQDAVVAQIAAQHEASVKMLRDWIALPSIAAENLNFPQGPEYMARLAREAGFQKVESSPPRERPASSPRSTRGPRPRSGSTSCTT